MGNLGTVRTVPVWRLLAAAVALVALATVLLAPPPAHAQQAEPITPVDDPHDACPLETNPAAPFTDRPAIPSVHVANVDCAYNADIVGGRPDGRYLPALHVRRDQFASMLVGMLRAGDVDLPDPSDQGWTDIEGNVHEDAINVLTATGIAEGVSETRYGPRETLRRDQTATFVLRAASYVEDVPLPNLQRPTGPFEDVPDGNAHSANINGARHFNLTIGRTATTYEPAMPTRRDQMASFLIRLLAALAEEGHLIAPEERVEEVDFETDVAVNPVGTSHTATVTVTDQLGDPVSGADVRFEVFRHDNPVVEAPAFAYLAALEQTATSGPDGRASITYTGPDHAADDRIAACVPRRDTEVPTGAPFCGVVVDLEDSPGQTVVPTDVVPAAVGQKKWGFLADALSAEAIGVRADLLGGELLELPEVSMTLPGTGGERSADVRDDLLVGDLGGLAYVGLTEVRAAGDLDFGIARAEAQAADVEVLGILGDLAAPVLGADAVETAATVTCEGPYDDLADASDTRFVNLTVAGGDIPVEVPPNTEVSVPGIAEIVLNEVIELTDGEEFGYTVRGLRVTLLSLLGDPAAEIIVGETTVMADCAD